MFSEVFWSSKQCIHASNGFRNDPVAWPASTRAARRAEPECAPPLGSARDRFRHAEVLDEALARCRNIKYQIPGQSVSACARGFCRRLFCPIACFRLHFPPRVPTDALGALVRLCLLDFRLVSREKNLETLDRRRMTATDTPQSVLG